MTLSEAMRLASIPTANYYDGRRMSEFGRTELLCAKIYLDYLNIDLYNSDLGPTFVCVDDACLVRFIILPVYNDVHRVAEDFFKFTTGMPGIRSNRDRQIIFMVEFNIYCSEHGIRLIYEGRHICEIKK